MIWNEIGKILGKHLLAYLLFTIYAYLLPTIYCAKLLQWCVKQIKFSKLYGNIICYFAIRLSRKLATWFGGLLTCLGDTSSTIRLAQSALVKLVNWPNHDSGGTVLDHLSFTVK